MPGYRLLRHQNYAATAEPLPETVRRKAIWAQVLLGTRGRTPSVKSTTGYNARWRRTPVQGFHYYLWWIPLSESELASPAPTDSVVAGADAGDGQTILIHGIRHHDETDTPIELRSLADFDEVALSSLDPRFGEQRAVGEALALGDVRLATIKGLPGSGKTISLFYLVRDLLNVAGLRNVLYVTYTARLKRAACDFLAAQDPAFAERVKIRTLTELERRSPACRPMSTLSASCASSPATWSSRTRPPWGPGGATRPPSTRRSVATSWAGPSPPTMRCPKAGWTRRSSLRIASIWQPMRLAAAWTWQTPSRPGGWPNGCAAIVSSWTRRPPCVPWSSCCRGACRAGWASWMP